VGFDDDDLPEKVTLPWSFVPGTEYAIVLRTGELISERGPVIEALGGFHMRLDGRIAKNSIWDLNFRPKCPDPRGMGLVNGLFWMDGYFLNSEPHLHGTSAAGKKIADGSNPAWLTPTRRVNRMNFWDAKEVLALYGKQLPSVAELHLAAQGVVDGKNCGNDPEKTGHVEGLRSDWDIEQVTGCMWTFTRDIDEDGYIRIFGGYWSTSAAGPRRLFGSGAFGGRRSVAARGRCDHLILG